MAITFRASATDDTGGGTSVTITKPVGTVEGDVMVCCFGNGQDDGTTPVDSLAAWTTVDFNEESAGTDGMFALFYKVAGGSEPADYTFDYPSSTSNQSNGIISTFIGVDNAAPLDVTYATLSHYLNEQNGGAAPTAQPITTESANAFVVVCNFHQLANTTAIVPPSGYTEAAEIIQGSRNGTMAYIDAGAADVETPGAYGMTDATAGTDHFHYTIALKPFVAATGGFTNALSLMGTG